MSSLQLALIIAGILLVVGVVVFNRWQEGRVRKAAGLPRATSAPAPAAAPRVEPTLTGTGGAAVQLQSTAESAARSIDADAVEHDAGWRPPMDEVVSTPAPRSVRDERAGEPAEELLRPNPTEPLPRRSAHVHGALAAPDPDIETIVRLLPAQPVAVEALAAGLNARLGKPVRWYGRRAEEGPWQRLAADNRGEYPEIAGCLLLADRNGPASRTQIDAFHALGGQLAAVLQATVTAAPAAEEAQRAETLDRLCAELDMQIGLTVRKAAPAIIAGTRLRGVAEASGFRLSPTGRFEWVQDETGAVLFTLQNLTDEAFTPESLRQGATSGVVFLLDVPRVIDPPKAFDHMKQAAKRMAQTVGGELVDDNGRPLNDAGLAAIRDQVAAADTELRSYNIEPGSPRALKLFAA